VTLVHTYTIQHTPSDVTAVTSEQNIKSKSNPHVTNDEERQVKQTSKIKSRQNPSKPRQKPPDAKNLQ
jgi:hypothetical protein